jgi:hypothetical protein
MWVWRDGGSAAQWMSSWFSFFFGFGFREIVVIDVFYKC